MNKAIIWAIDPFETETTPDREVLKAFLLWSKSLGIPVQPVHILSFITAYEMANWNSKLKDGTPTIPSAEKVARSYLSNLRVVKDVLSPKVELTASYSRKKEIQKLMAVAEIHDSPLIAVSSHGRSGFDRLALGSFAERLLTESKRPVLFLSQTSSKSAVPIKKVLFPTDLSQKSEVAFRQFLPHAKALGAEVLLFHAITFPSIGLSSGGIYGGAGAAIPEGYFNNLAQWSSHAGAHWIELAKASGVSARMIIEDEGVTSQIAPLILDHARKEQVQLIAMASLSGPLTSWVAGSVAREVFRTREYPVWVCGPKSIEGRSLDERARTEPPPLSSHQTTT